MGSKNPKKERSEFIYISGIAERIYELRDRSGSKDKAWITFKVRFYELDGEEQELKDRTWYCQVLTTAWNFSRKENERKLIWKCETKLQPLELGYTVLYKIPRGDLYYKVGDKLSPIEYKGIPIMYSENGTLECIDQEIPWVARPVHEECTV